MSTETTANPETPLTHREAVLQEIRNQAPERASRLRDLARYSRESIARYEKEIDRYEEEIAKLEALPTETDDEVLAAYYAEHPERKLVNDFMDAVGGVEGFRKVFPTAKVLWENPEVSLYWGDEEKKVYLEGKILDCYHLQIRPREPGGIFFFLGSRHRNLMSKTFTSVETLVSYLETSFNVRFAGSPNPPAPPVKITLPAELRGFERQLGEFMERLGVNVNVAVAKTRRPKKAAE